MFYDFIIRYNFKRTSMRFKSCLIMKVRLMLKISVKKYFINQASKGFLKLAEIRCKKLENKTEYKTKNPKFSRVKT